MGAKVGRAVEPYGRGDVRNEQEFGLYETTQRRGVRPPRLRYIGRVSASFWN